MVPGCYKMNNGNAQQQKSDTESLKSASQTSRNIANGFRDMYDSNSASVQTMNLPGRYKISTRRIFLLKYENPIGVKYL